MSKEKTSPISKKIGTLAEKMLILANKGAKKLEAYAAQSAEENQNENARKLAATMNKLSQTLEEKQETYAEDVAKNADEMADNIKKVYTEMKNRVHIAKEKANKDCNDDTSSKA